MFLKNTDVKRFCVLIMTILCILGLTRYFFVGNMNGKIFGILIMTILFVLGLSMYSFGKKEKFLQN